MGFLSYRLCQIATISISVMRELDDEWFVERHKERRRWAVTSCVAGRTANTVKTVISIDR